MSKIVIKNLVRFSYAKVFEAETMPGNDKAQYSVSLLIPKTDKETLAAIEAGIQEAKEYGKGAKWGGKIPANVKVPLRDGDLEKEDDENYKGMYFINAKSYTRPQVVDVNLNPIMDPDEFYSGCYGRASVTFYPYDANGSKGVACGLGNLQKVKDGDKLSGGSTAAEDFGAFDDDLGI